MRLPKAYKSSLKITLSLPNSPNSTKNYLLFSGKRGLQAVCFLLFIFVSHSLYAQEVLDESWTVNDGYKIDADQTNTANTSILFGSPITIPNGRRFPFHFNQYGFINANYTNPLGTNDPGEPWHQKYTRDFVRLDFGYRHENYNGVKMTDATSFILMSLLQNGNVGIGTNSPAEKLDVAGTIKATGLKLPTNAGAGKVLVSDAYGVASWSTVTVGSSSGSSGWTLNGSNPTTAGNVGIGISSPEAKLDVNGVIRVYNKDNPTATWDNVQVYATGLQTIIESSGDENGMVLRSNTGHKIILNDKVGIGNANPTRLLEIGADDATNTVTMLQVHGGAIFNNDADQTHLTKVRINTAKYVEGAALTVGGPTYIGSWQTAESGVESVTRVTNANLAKYSLWVERGVVSEDFVYAANATWRDEVFEPDYKLPSLGEVEQFVKENKHLPGIPSAQEVSEKGYSGHEINKALLEKIEHLMLYSIEQEKQIKELRQKLNTLEANLKK